VTLIEKPSGGTLMLEGVDAVNPPASTVKTLRRTVQIVFQNPYGSLNPRKRIGDILEEPLIINTKLSKPDRRAQALDMMAKVGLRPEQYGRYPHMFSGGQRQRIAIARALMLRPKLLVADEPVSALDMSVQAQVLNLLVDLQRELGLAYLFISHDLAVVRQVADRVAVMNLGCIVENAGADELFASPRHPYSRALLSAIPVPKPRAQRARIILQGDLPSALDPPSGCRFHTRCPYAVARCGLEAPELLADARGHATACHRLGELPPASDMAIGDAAFSPSLDRMIAAFTRKAQMRRAGGIDTVATTGATGRE
jgi:oligopeptide/dipeptide ABC transporter ATP-binding protein